jgi:hypothetical protein
LEKGIQKKTRAKVIKTIKKWSGKLIEPKYSTSITASSQLKIKLITKFSIQKIEYQG